MEINLSHSLILILNLKNMFILFIKDLRFKKKIEITYKYDGMGVKTFPHFGLFSKPGRVFASVHPNLFFVLENKYSI